MVRPEGCIGTCGWIDGKPWTARFCKAVSASHAIQKKGKDVFS